jgi:leucyl-tRNA synthetase
VQEGRDHVRVNADRQELDIHQSEWLQNPGVISEEDAKKAALASEAIQKALEGNPPRKVIYVKGRLVNIVL